MLPEAVTAHSKTHPQSEVGLQGKHFEALQGLLLLLPSLKSQHAAGSLKMHGDPTPTRWFGVPGLHTTQPQWGFPACPSSPNRPPPSQRQLRAS